MITHVLIISIWQSTSQFYFRNERWLATTDVCS